MHLRSLIYVDESRLKIKVDGDPLNLADVGGLVSCTERGRRILMDHVKARFLHTGQDSRVKLSIPRERLNRFVEWTQENTTRERSPMRFLREQVLDHIPYEYDDEDIEITPVGVVYPKNMEGTYLGIALHFIDEYWMRFEGRLKEAIIFMAMEGDPHIYLEGLANLQTRMDLNGENGIVV